MLTLILLFVFGTSAVQEDVEKMDELMTVTSTLPEGTYLLDSHLLGEIRTVKQPKIYAASKQKLKMFDARDLRVRRADVFSDQTVAFFSTSKSTRKIRLVESIPDIGELGSFVSISEFENVFGKPQKKVFPDFSSTFNISADGKATVNSNMSWEVCCVEPDESFSFLRVVLYVSESQGKTFITDHWLQQGKLKLVPVEKSTNQIHVKSTVQSTARFLKSLKGTHKTKVLDKTKVPRTVSENDTAGPLGG